MTRYIIEPLPREDATMIALRDTVSGATAHIWPEVGFNLLALHLPVTIDGGTRLVDTIMGPPTLDDLRTQPTWWGTPLLWPYPGRTPRGEYRFRGTDYRFGPPSRPDEPDPLGEGSHRYDMHGFVRHLPWRITGQEATATYASLTATFTSEDHPETLLGYPFPYHLTATWTLDEAGAHLDFTVENVGTGDLPFGYGAHPYLRTPLGDHGDMSGCVASLGATHAWSPEPSSTESTVPVAPTHDLRAGQPVARNAWNGIRTGLPISDGWWVGQIDDRENVVRAAVHATANQPFCVVFVAPWGDGICFEPWTCPGDVFNLADADIPDHGLIVLPPQGTWTGSMRLTATGH